MSEGAAGADKEMRDDEAARMERARVKSVEMAISAHGWRGVSDFLRSARAALDQRAAAERGWPSERRWTERMASTAGREVDEDD